MFRKTYVLRGSPHGPIEKEMCHLKAEKNKSFWMFTEPDTISLFCLLMYMHLQRNHQMYDDRNHQMYDAALLTRCYTQHALRPFIDSESNHIRNFIKTPFINKGIDFIDLPSIFQDKSVIQSIPTYFQNSEPPIICYKYNKPIRNTIF